MKTVLYIAITINGMVADTIDDTSFTSKEDWACFQKTAERIGIIIIGRKTYEIMAKDGNFWKDCQWIVLSKTEHKKSNYPNVIFTKESPKELLGRLEKDNVKSIMVAGGSKLNGSFLQQDLINEIHLDIEPALWMNGKPLCSAFNKKLRLRLKKIVKLSPQTIHLEYTVLH